MLEEWASKRNCNHSWVWEIRCAKAIGGIARGGWKRSVLEK